MAMKTRTKTKKFKQQNVKPKWIIYGYKNNWAAHAARSAFGVLKITYEKSEECVVHVQHTFVCLYRAIIWKTQEYNLLFCRSQIERFGTTSY